MRNFRATPAAFLAILLAAGGASTVARAEAPPSLVVGLSADLSAGSAEAGEAIRRGATIAIDLINARGGVLGRQLELVRSDHRGNPARGVDGLEQMVKLPNLVAVIGGLHSVVAFEQLPIIQANGIPFMIPWAAATRLVENDTRPNHVFRISVRDQDVGAFLVREARAAGRSRVGLLLEQTAWGRSNHQAILAALGSGAEPPMAWFLQGSRSLDAAVRQLLDQGADSILLVANAPEAVVAAEALSRLPAEQRPPVFAHWGLTGGDFYRRTAAVLPAIDLAFVQTFSFLDPPFPDRARPVLEACRRLFADCSEPAAISAPSGLAQAYDIIGILATAIAAAGTADRAAVRDSLERIERFEGLMRDYAPPFTSDRHDALAIGDLRLGRFDGAGFIVPAVRSR